MEILVLNTEAVKRNFDVIEFKEMSDLLCNSLLLAIVRVILLKYCLLVSAIDQRSS